MKHARDDYARIQDPENKIPDDEPVFLLRAQDVIAADVVRIWATLNRAHGGDYRLSLMASRCADIMDKWPKKKPADWSKPYSILHAKEATESEEGGE